MLFNAEKLMAAFADIGETQATVRLDLQLKYHSWQVGSQGTESCLTLLEHFQSSAVIGAVARVSNHELNQRNQALQSSPGEGVMGAGAHRPRRGIVVDVV